MVMRVAQGMPLAVCFHSSTTPITAREQGSGAVGEKRLKRAASSSNRTSLRAGKLKGWDLSKAILNVKTGNLKGVPSAS